MTAQSVRQMVRQRAKLAGVKAPSLHSFRKAFALYSLRNGADPVSLSRMLRHRSLLVILCYLKQERGDLAQVHNRTSPVDTWALGGKHR